MVPHGWAFSSDHGSLGAIIEPRQINDGFLWTFSCFLVSWTVWFFQKAVLVKRVENLNIAVSAAELSPDVVRDGGSSTPQMRSWFVLEIVISNIFAKNTLQLKPKVQSLGIASARLYHIISRGNLIS